MSEEMNNAPLTMETIRTGTAVQGTVTRLVLAGAMLDIGIGQEALLHLSQVGRNDFRNIEDVFQVGDVVEGYVYKVDRDNQRVSLTMIKPAAVQWNDIEVGRSFQGKVVRIEKFGAFVDIGAERPGMVHVSEMGDDYIQSPEDVVRVGDIIEVRVLKMNRKKRLIDLTMKSPKEDMRVQIEEEQDHIPTAMELALRRAQATNKRGDNRNSRRDRRYNDDEQDEIISRTLKHQYK